MWVIGDVAGQFMALTKLISQIKSINSDSEIVLCGDLVDRGPDSKKVIL